MDRGEEEWNLGEVEKSRGTWKEKKEETIGEKPEGEEKRSQEVRRRRTRRGNERRAEKEREDGKEEEGGRVGRGEEPETRRKGERSRRKSGSLRYGI